MPRGGARPNSGRKVIRSGRRLSVRLTHAAGRGLDAVCRRTGESPTDALNRILETYDAPDGGRRVLVATGGPRRL